MAARQITCAECGAQTSAGHPTARFCSERCRRVSERARAAANRPEVKCAGCGQAFRPKGSDRTKFCSRECSFADLTKNGTRKAGWIPLRLQRVFYTVERPLCVECGKRFTAGKGQTICSDECRHKRVYYQPKPKVNKPCNDCGEEITGTAAKRRCEACAKRASRRNSRLIEIANGVRSARRKARKLRVRCATVEIVNPLVVLQRDKWRCQLCGVSTPKRLRGTYDDRAPEVDHIVTLAQGGEHSYRNTQCACRRCNIAKAATTKGQLRLFG